MLTTVFLLLVGVIAVGLVVVVLALRGSSSEPNVVQLKREAKLAPANPDTKSQLGFVLQQQGRYDEAVAMYDSALKSNPKDLAALYNRGVCLIASGEGAQGAESLRKTIDIAPTHVLAATALGEYYLKHHQFAPLVKAVAPAANKNPGLSDLHYLLARGLEQTGKKQEAVREYRQALKTNPRLTEAQQGLGRLSAYE